MERRGIPSAAVAIRQLASNVGVAMASAQGLPNYPIAMIDGDADITTSVDESFAEALGGRSGVARLADTVASIWLTGTAD